MKKTVPEFKGWSFEEAEKMTQNMFAEYETCPLGIKTEEWVQRTLTKEERKRENHTNSL